MRGLNHSERGRHLMAFGDDTKPFDITKALCGDRGMLGGRLSHDQKPSLPIYRRKLIEIRN